MLLHQTNAYVRKLMIMDHIREINDLYDLHKRKEIDWSVIQKELADLLILIQDDVSAALLQERLAKFKLKGTRRL